MKGEEQDLFDLTPYEIERGRKAPESAAAKTLATIAQIKARELKNLERKVREGRTLTAAEIKRLRELEAELQGLEGRNLPEGIVRTALDVAKHFGRTVRTIRNWAGRGMPQLPNGYDLTAIEIWAVKEGLTEGAAGQVDEGGNGGAGPVLDRNYYETELKRVQSELKNLDLARIEGKLIPLEEVEAGRMARITAVKRSLLATPRALAPQLVGMEAREIEAALTERMRDICARFARGDS